MKIDSGSIIISLSTYPREQTIDDFITIVDENIKKFKKGCLKNFNDLKLKNKIDFDKDEFNHIPEKLNSFESIDENIIPEYQRERDFHLYYNPLKYHIWGKYDVAFVTLADNFSLAKKVFLPTRLNVNSKAGYLKTHVLSGIPLQCGEESYENKFRDLLGYSRSGRSIYNLKESTFISISNLKVNNSFLIGNGLYLINLVIDKIKQLLDGYKNYFIVKSFASFEISLVLFSDDIDKLKEKLLSIRGLDFRGLIAENNDSVLDEIIHNSILSEEEKDEKNVEVCLNSHVFADSQSFFGIRLNNQNDWIINQRKNFNTIVEWEIRPGHEKYIKKFFNGIFNNLAEKNDNFFSENVYFLPGKRDFYFNIETNDLSINHKIYTKLRESNPNDNDPLRDHVRSIQTKVLLRTNRCDDEEYLNASIDERKILKGRTQGSTEIQKYFIGTLNDINTISQQLKCLKISKELRNRIIKVIYNFETAIQNPLVSNLFFDLSFFVNYLKEQIKYSSDLVHNFFDKSKFNIDISRVFDIDTKFNDLVEHFEGAFNLRYINNYSFDEISDFLIGYNSPIQQVITSFDNYFKTLYSKITDDEIAKEVITKVYDLQTISTATTVNFSIYNLYEPGLLFYSATKEIFTIFFKNDKNELKDVKNEVRNQYKFFSDSYFAFYPNSPAKTHKQHLEKYDPLYYLIDYIRFKMFFDVEFNDRGNSNSVSNVVEGFKCFLFWHLAYIIQSPTTYNILGAINNEQLQKEFCRLLFIAIGLDIDYNHNNDMDLEKDKGSHEQFLLDNCPLPEMLCAWNHRYKEIRPFIYKLLTTENVITEKEVKKTTYYNFIKQQTNPFLMKMGSSENALSSVPNKIVFSPDFLFNQEKNIDIDNLKNFFIKENYKKAIADLTVFYLRTIFEHLSSSDSLAFVQSIKRDWNTGKKMKPVQHDNNEPDKSPYYLFDPSGGVFFNSFQKSKQFSLIRNKLFLILMHHASLLKESLYCNWKKMKSDGRKKN